MKKLITFTLVAAAVLPATAQKTPTTSAKPASQASVNQEACAALVGFIHKNLKNMAAQRMEGITDNSAPRATNRLLNEVVSSTAIQTTTQQLIALKCEMPEGPFDPNIYFPAALGCESARAEKSMGSLGGGRPSAEKIEKEKEACTQAAWKPNS